MILSIFESSKIVLNQGCPDKAVWFSFNKVPDNDFGGMGCICFYCVSYWYNGGLFLTLIFVAKKCFWSTKVAAWSMKIRIAYSDVSDGCCLQHWVNNIKLSPTSLKADQNHSSAMDLTISASYFKIIFHIISGLESATE